MVATVPATRYRRRVLDSELDELLPGLAAVALEGAKGVGKTVTAARRAKTTVALDSPRVRAVITADPASLLDRPTPLLLDEWQRVPEVWDLVRRRVDADAAPGSFLLTGSAYPRGLGTHSGAGRIVRLRMRPMTLAERGGSEPTVSLAALISGSRPQIGGGTAVTAADYLEEVCATGLPGIRGLTGRLRRAQLDGYLQNIVDRDLEELNQEVRNPHAMRRWLEAYAAATATTTAYERIRESATPGEGDKPSKATTARYRDALERLWILDALPAWRPSTNAMARLAAAPKHHLADPGLAARLLGVDVGALMDVSSDRPETPRNAGLAGRLFESLVTLGVRVYAQAAEARVGHFRSHVGDREVDLVVERGDHRVVAVEVKFSATIGDVDVRHLRWLQDRLGPELLDAVVVSTGPYAYRRRDGIAVVPAALLGP